MGLKDWIEAPAASVVPAARSKLNLLRGAAARLTTPLLPDDYLHLANPLWSARELRGQIVEVRPRPRTRRPSSSSRVGDSTSTTSRGSTSASVCISTAVGIGGRTHLPRLPTGRTSAFPSRSRPCPRLSLEPPRQRGRAVGNHRSTGHAFGQLRVAGSATGEDPVHHRRQWHHSGHGHVADDEPARSIARRHAHPLGSDGIRRDVRRRTHSTARRARGLREPRSTHAT